MKRPRAWTRSEALTQEAMERLMAGRTSMLR
jgi:hypothetical protein